MVWDPGNMIQTKEKQKNVTSAHLLAKGSSSSRKKMVKEEILEHPEERRDKPEAVGCGGEQEKYKHRT